MSSTSSPLDINLIFYYIITCVRIWSYAAFNIGKKIMVCDGAVVGLSSAFYANNICGFHFFLIKSIRPRYLVVT